MSWPLSVSFLHVSMKSIQTMFQRRRCQSEAISVGWVSQTGTFQSNSQIACLPRSSKKTSQELRMLSLVNLYWRVTNLQWSFKIVVLCQKSNNMCSNGLLYCCSLRLFSKCLCLCLFICHCLLVISCLLIIVLITSPSVCPMIVFLKSDTQSLSDKVTPRGALGKLKTNTFVARGSSI